MKKKNLLLWSCLLICLVAAVQISLAQESPDTKPQNQNEESPSTPSQDQGARYPSTPSQEDKAQSTPTQDQGEESEILPADEKSESGGSLGAQSIVDDVFQSTQNLLGFSVGVNETYTSQIFSNNLDKRVSGVTSVTPRAFINLGKRKSILHLDFGAGYRHYNGRKEFNVWDYYGSAQYSLTFSKRVSLSIFDKVTSSYNDAGSMVSQYSPMNIDNVFSNELLYDRQRITRNTLNARLNYLMTRKASLGIYGSYELYDFQQVILINSSAAQAGVDFSYEICKWVSLSSNYSAYLNNVDEQFRDTRIHSLQFGGLDFRIARSWSIWGRGGLDYSENQGTNNFHESINAGIGYSSKANSLGINYQRGFTSAIGVSRLLSSDIISAQLGRRMTRWMNTRLNSSYYRSRDQSSGLLETLAGGCGLEFALTSNIITSMNYTYQNQKYSNFSFPGARINRYIANVSVQYFWPSRKRAGS
jgi:hypothetical protein